MINFKGFNTINKHKKFGMVDYDLIKRDLINALNIREGEMPGRPDIGTSIWSHIFEPNTTDTRNSIKKEIMRIIKQDPRLIVDTIIITYEFNTIIVEVSIIVSPNASAEKMFLKFDQESGQLSIS